MIKRDDAEFAHAALVNRCQALLSRRLAGARPLVPVESLPSVGGNMQHFHRLRIGEWLCQIKLTGMCIVLEVRTEERGSAAFAMVGATTRILTVGDAQTSLAVVKGTREPRIQLGDNVAVAAEIAYQYGLQVGQHGTQAKGSFYDSPAFHSIILALEATRKPINPLFCKPYIELGDWYAVAQRRLADRHSVPGLASRVAAVAPADDERALVVSHEPCTKDSIEVSRATLLAWGRRHSINGKTLGEMRAAFLDAATLVILEHASSRDVGAMGTGPVALAWEDELVALAQGAQQDLRQDNDDESAEGQHNQVPLSTF